MDLNGDGKHNWEDNFWLFVILNNIGKEKEYCSDNDFSCCDNISFLNIALIFMIVTLPFCFFSEYGWIGAIGRIVVIIMLLLAKRDM